MGKKANKDQASRIEIAKALRNVKSIATPPQYAEVQAILAAGHVDHVADSVAGLSEEDEFALLCILMGTATHITALEQRHSIAAGNAAPDFLIRFQPGFYQQRIPASSHRGYRCFVEVKTTKKQTLRVSGSHLKKLRAFADAFGFPLLFAVRFTEFKGAALWVIVEDANRHAAAVRITVSDYTAGLRPVLWNERAYMLLPGTYFQATYSSETTGKGVRHLEYGELVGFQLVTQKERIPLSGDEAAIAHAFFEPYGLKEAKVLREGHLVHAAYTAENMVLSEADLLYGINNLVRDKDGNLAYDAGKIIRQLAEGASPTVVPRDFVKYYANTFSNMNVLAPMGYGEPEKEYEKWLATGGVATPSTESGQAPG